MSRPSIFQKIVIPFIIIGSITIIILQGNNYFSLRHLIIKELKSQFLTSLTSAAEYFETTYAVSIDRDLKFIERSDALNNFLSSQKDEMLLNHPSSERLFLFFTHRDRGIYLSARFIDAKGVEKIVVEGSKRIKHYVSFDAVPEDAFYTRLSVLFSKLKSEKTGVILCEGPFKYQDKYTFLVGIVKGEPEIGGVAGAVIFHCDLTDYFNHLAEYKFYGERVATVVSLDNKIMLSPAGDDTAKQKSKDYYALTKEIKIGSGNQTLFNVVFGISPKIFQAETKKALTHSLLFISLALFIFSSTAFVIAKQLSRPLVNLSGSVKRFTQGELSYRVNIDTANTREIQVLAETFNEMTDEIQKRNEELRKAQEELIRKEKLAVVGQLASSVAHELRNPLGVIKNAVYYLNMLESGKDNPDLKENMDIISAEIENSDKIISDLLEFSRIKQPALNPAEMNLIIKETLNRVKTSSDIKVVTELGENLPPIQVDALQMQQVFYNLASNAIQAMEKGGTLTVSSCVTRDENIAITFKDTGYGIPPENLKKIFEPLFSTKTKGTGLGLSVVASLVEGHGGKIEIESAMGKGSAFTVKLPIRQL